MSSASIVTFVCSSPRHQPSVVLEREQVLDGPLQRDLRLVGHLEGQLWHGAES